MFKENEQLPRNWKATIQGVSPSTIDSYDDVLQELGVNSTKNEDVMDPSTIDELSSSESKGDIKAEDIFVCEGIIKQESQSDETSIKCLTGISDDTGTPMPDLDSFEDVIKTETFLPIKREDDIVGEPLELLPVKMEDPLAISS